MDWELLYTLANGLAVVAWLPLFIAPRAALTERYAGTPLVPLGFALVYAALVGLMFAGDGGGGMDSLASLRRGFSSDPVLLLAWVHYLCFDLMIGFWELRDSRRLGIHPWLLRPCLFLTLMLGPLGLLLYMGVRVGSGHGIRFSR
ncbi:MAG: DUF4281 domain-containing protein [Alphaproteobacteria bacterium]|nr:DUF4281 domain-containing protein [Alphaproteobacteria bacterium]